MLDQTNCTPAAASVMIDKTEMNKRFVGSCGLDTVLLEACSGHETGALILRS